MSLLDSGIRFSACTTLTDCEIAVLSAEAMDEMMSKDPNWRPAWWPCWRVNCRCACAWSAPA